MKSVVGIKMKPVSVRGKRRLPKGVLFFAAFSIFIFFLCVAGVPLAAETPGSIFSQANSRYDDGDFRGAVALYEQLISGGVIGGNIYYNLGNAYYKLGKKGKALLNYERAKKFIPDNEDLFANISFIKSTLDVEQPRETYPLYQKIWTGIRDAISIRAWFFIAAVFFFSTCLTLGTGFLIYRLRKKIAIISGILAFLFIISFVFFIDSYAAIRHSKIGIIIAPQADVRYSPSYSGAVAFKLIEGMKAQIIRHQGDWTHIRLNREKSGWIESDAIEAVW